MSAFGGASFNEPTTDDTTSAPSMSIPNPMNPVNPTKKKRKPFGPNVRNPGALAAAISRSKRAFQSGRKYGGS